ncbi:putative nucleotidyltransferase component of viral defense system [Bradyrhizobium sp. USDA 4341]
MARPRRLPSERAFAENDLQGTKQRWQPLAAQGRNQHPRTHSILQAREKPFSLENEWFSGKAQITTFLVEEILSTKFRALLQRDKGRDIFDLGRAIEEFDGMVLESW